MPVRPRGSVLRLLALLMLPLTAPSGVATADPGRESRPPTPVLIERAVDLGALNRADADAYLVAAMRGEPIPVRFRSETPYRGTLILLELHRRLEHLPAGPRRRSLRELLHPMVTGGMDQCEFSASPLPDTTESTHFYIEYNDAFFGGGLDINDYVAALEGAWTKEVDQFGWAAPPVYTPNPAPGSKYPVRIDNIGPGFYGFVSNFGTHAGFVGNNPNTSWNEGDANASCMVLNANYDPFPGEPLAALQATAAHEFNHSIQFGWGALFGSNVPDESFIEGITTWFEDEVFDEANDNYNYLWPSFEDDMGQYDGSPYPYWVTWRGLSERYGAGVPGGAEEVFQRFWELTSKNQADSLEALESSLDTEGTSLSSAYHAYAIAVRFARSCGGGYQYPHCLEEGPGYVAAEPLPPPHAGVVMGGTHQGSLQDNYALHWISLPQNTRLQVILKNTSNGGRFRGSVACDTGTGLVIEPFSNVVDQGETAYVRSWDPGSCPNPIAVVTNVTQTAANPQFSEQRGYSLTVTPPAEPTRLSISGRVAGGRVIASGRLAPSGGDSRVEVVLLERDGRWKEVKTRTVRAGGGIRFRTKFPQPDATRCRLEAEFAGDDEHLPSQDRDTFRC